MGCIQVTSITIPSLLSLSLFISFVFFFHTRVFFPHCRTMLYLKLLLGDYVIPTNNCKVSFIFPFIHLGHYNGP